MRVKTRKKSEAFWRHGKHKGMLTVAIEKNKQRKRRSTEKMYSSVKELMEKEGRRR